MTASTLRFVKEVNLHLTWAFIGEIDEEKIPDIEEVLKKEVKFLQDGTSLQELAASLPGGDYTRKREKESLENAITSLDLAESNPALAAKKALSIEMQYDFIEAWPSTMAGRVLVATPAVVPEQVLRIGMSLRSALTEFATADRNEPRNLLFRPHVTIARLNPPENFGDGRVMESMSALLPIKHHIDSMHLIKSDPVAGLYKSISTPW